MKTIKKRKKEYFPYYMLIPAIIAILGITLYPIIYSFIVSFFDYAFVRKGMKFIGFDNYIDIIREGNFLYSIKFTLLWTFVNLTLMSILGFATALLLSSKFHGKYAIKTTLLIPWILPQVVTGFIWSLMLSQDMGIVNRLLNIVGLVPVHFSWFQSYSGTFWAVVLANSWRGFPFMALMLYAKLQTLPVEQVEAARIDGGSPLQIFRYITLNYLKQIYLTCLLLTFLWTFNAFDIIRIMTNGGPIQKTTTIALLVQKEAFDFFEISKASAMSILMFIVILSISLLAIAIKKMLERYYRNER